MEDSFIKDELLVVLVLYERSLLESVAYKSLSVMGEWMPSKIKTNYLIYAR